jgi:hypothetical protein
VVNAARLAVAYYGIATTTAMAQRQARGSPHAGSCADHAGSPVHDHHDSAVTDRLGGS